MTIERDPAGRPQRRHERTDLTLLVQYRFNTFEDFLTEYAINLSPGGMFLHTEDPREEGSILHMQFSLADGSKLVEGMGRVVRVVPPGGARLPGMAIEFVQLDEETRALIRQICESKTRKPGS